MRSFRKRWTGVGVGSGGVERTGGELSVCMCVSACMSGLCNSCRWLHKNRCIYRCSSICTVTH